MRSIIRLAATLVLGAATTGAIADVAIVNFGTTGYFYGQLGAAATASGPDAFIQCQLSGASLSCGASDQTGASARCSTTDAAVKNMFPMMDKSSIVQVFYDNAGNCTKMAVVNLTRDLRLSSPAGSIKQSVPVSIDAANRIARGSISARPVSPNPDVTHESINCTVRGNSVYECIAVDANSNSVHCLSFRSSAVQTLADQLLAAQAINEYSSVSFTYDAQQLPECTSITVNNASYFGP
ncbi:MAG TPA: hypothetical protein VNN25_03590 [Thermoanaerobaculia bacterium]|nr:hypothetical protein [Thermoanaerobaculia bacterium]